MFELFPNEFELTHNQKRSTVQKNHIRRICADWMFENGYPNALTDIMLSYDKKTCFDWVPTKKRNINQECEAGFWVSRPISSDDFDKYGQTLDVFATAHQTSQKDYNVYENYFMDLISPKQFEHYACFYPKFNLGFFQTVGRFNPTECLALWNNGENNHACINYSETELNHMYSNIDPMDNLYLDSFVCNSEFACQDYCISNQGCRSLINSCLIFHDKTFLRPRGEKINQIVLCQLIALINQHLAYEKNPIKRKTHLVIYDKTRKGFKTVVKTNPRIARD